MDIRIIYPTPSPVQYYTNYQQQAITHLDVAVSQPFAQSARHQHEPTPAQKRHPPPLHLGPPLRPHPEGLPAGHLRSPPVQRILPPPGSGQEGPGGGDVSPQPPRGVGGVHLGQLGQEGQLALGADGLPALGAVVVPGGEEVGLVARRVAQRRRQGALLLAQAGEEGAETGGKGGIQRRFQLGPALDDDKGGVVGVLRFGNLELLDLGLAAAAIATALGRAGRRLGRVEGGFGHRRPSSGRGSGGRGSSSGGGGHVAPRRLPSARRAAPGVDLLLELGLGEGFPRQVRGAVAAGGHDRGCD